MGRKKIPGYMPGGRPKKAGKANDMMKQVQKMQEQFMQQQAELEEEEITETAGGGAVSVTVNGKMEVTAVKIDPDVVDEDDVEMLEDLVMAAVNSALDKVREKSQDALGGLAGGMGMPNIPGLF